MSCAFCLDFGNTRNKIAIFEKHQLLHTIELSNDNQEEELQQLLLQYQPQQSILSSVIHHSPHIETLLQKHSKQYIHLTHLTPLPFYLPFAKPETMGADRLALVAATIHLTKIPSNFLVIALGTCITYNFINTRKMFLGGSISPGVQMRFKAMHAYTSKLPLIENKENDYSLIGYDTKSNLISGVLLGVEKEIDGVIDEYKKKYNKLHCILTGGDADFFAERLKNNIFADHSFLFKGLYEILQFQA